MGIRSDESIALGRVADKLQTLCDTMNRIEKDLHSIDISLGKMSDEAVGFDPVPDIGALARKVVDGDKGEE